MLEAGRPSPRSPGRTPGPARAAVTGVTYRKPGNSCQDRDDARRPVRQPRGCSASTAHWFEAEHDEFGFAFPRSGERMDRLDVGRVRTRAACSPPAVDLRRRALPHGCAVRANNDLRHPRSWPRTGHARRPQRGAGGGRSAPAGTGRSTRGHPDATGCVARRGGRGAQGLLAEGRVLRASTRRSPSTTASRAGPGAAPLHRRWSGRAHAAGARRNGPGAGPSRPGGATVRSDRSITIAATEESGWVREAAGEQFDALELNVYPTGPPMLTGHPRKEAADVLDRIRARTGVGVGVDEFLASPHVFIGSVAGLTCASSGSAQDHVVMAATSPRCPGREAARGDVDRGGPAAPARRPAPPPRPPRCRAPRGPGPDPGAPIAAPARQLTPAPHRLRPPRIETAALGARPCPSARAGPSAIATPRDARHLSRAARRNPPASCAGDLRDRHALGCPCPHRRPVRPAAARADDRPGLDDHPRRARVAGHRHGHADRRRRARRPRALRLGLPAFFLGNLVGIVLAGGALDRMPLHRPFAAGLVLFGAGLLIGGLAPSMPILVLARFIQGLGGGAIGPTAYVAIGRVLPEPPAADVRDPLAPRGSCPGSSAPRSPPSWASSFGWRWVFLGLLPFLVVAGGSRSPPCRVTSTMPEARAPGRARDPRRVWRAIAAGWRRRASRRPRCRTRADRGRCSSAARCCSRPTAGSPRAGRSPRRRRAGRDPAPGRDDVRVLLGRRLHPAAPPDVARDTGGPHRHRVHRDDGGLDRRHLDSRRDGSTGWGPAVRRAGLRADRPRRAGHDPVVLAAVPPEIAVVTWALPGLGMGFMYSAVTLVVLRGSAAAEQGRASSSLQLSDILGTALGTGVAGAITAAGERAGRNGLGVALAVVFAVSPRKRPARASPGPPDRPASRSCGRRAAAVD